MATSFRSSDVSRRNVCSATSGCVKFIEPVQLLYSFYMSGSMSLVSQAVRFLVKNKHDLAYVESDRASRSCGNGTSSSGTAEVEAEAARWLMYMNLAVILPALFSTIYLGGLSNRVGRKTVLLLPLIGGALRMFIFVFVIVLRLHVAFLVLSSFVDGCFGMSCSMLMACFSYASDTTTHQQRSIRFVILQVFSGFSLIISSLATGFLIKAIGYEWMFVVLLGVLALTFCYIVFVLRESLVLPHHPEPAGLCTQSRDAMVNTFSLFVRDDGMRRRGCLLMALFVCFLVSFVQLGRMDVQILYLFSFPFCFNSVWIGYYNAACYFVVNLFMVLATWTLARSIGDIGLVFLGAIFGLVYEFVFGFAVNTLMVFLAPVAGCGMIMPISLLRAYISKTVDPPDVASAFALFAWLEMISALVGGITQNAIFSATASWQPNAVFLFDAGVYAAVVVIVFFFLIYLRHLKQQFRYQQVINYDEDNSDYVTDSEDVALHPEQR